MNSAAHDQPELLLGNARKGFFGVIQRIEAHQHASSLAPGELESQLIEMGFVEGMQVEILHQGAIGDDPIAVRIDNVTVALRRREAMAIVVK